MAAVLSPLAGHLADVKRRLSVIALTVCAAFVLCFAYASDLIEWFRRPFPNELIFYGPAEALFATVKIAFMIGVVLSLPVILHQFWGFIRPALLPTEQRWAIPLFCLATAFFALGLVFCNLVILPLVIQFFVTFGMDREVTPQLAVGLYVDFNVKFLLIFGFAFELPLVLTLLSRAGIVSPALLSRYRKHAVMVALIASAVITPDATLFTMLLMAVPLVILYEIGILGCRLFGRRSPAQTAAPVPDEGLPPPGSSGGLPVETAGIRTK